MSVSGKIWRGTAFMSSANVLARVGTFLGNLAIIRLLGLDLLGELGLIESWLSVAMMFSIFGLSSAVTKYVSQFLESDPAQIGETAATAMVLGGVASAAVGSMVFLILGCPASRGGCWARPPEQVRPWRSWLNTP